MSGYNGVFTFCSAIVVVMCLCVVDDVETEMTSIVRVVLCMYVYTYVMICYVCST